MDLALANSDVSPVLSVLVAFIIAFVCTPAGVSGAFLLLPYQLSVLNFTSPGVTPTNLLFNVFSTPGGILQYRARGSLDGRLVLAILRGAVPGIVAGSIVRVTVLPDPDLFKRFVGVVLLGLGANLIVRAMRGPVEPRSDRDSPYKWISLVGLGAGTIGGIYGISGGSIIAPVLVGFFGLSVRRVAPAALVATLLTSTAGVISFQILEWLAAESDPARAPDWGLALLLGIGGFLGSTAGARVNTLLPERMLRGLLGGIAIVLGSSYVLQLT